jgi:hypothetical protein
VSAVARPARMPVAERKARFVTWFKERFFLRFHMAVLLGLTFAAGLGVTKLMLVAGSTNLALRWGVAVAASYGAFLLLLKLWLLYIQHEDEEDRPDALDAADTVDGVMDVLRDVGDPSRGFRAGGGGYSGGGGSSSFGEADAGGVTSLAPDVDDDFGLVIAAAIVLVAVAAAGGYLIYAGPTILADAAFEALLASALVPGVRRGEATGWMGPAVRATVLPFLAMLVLAAAAGAFAGGYCPEARRMVDVLRCAGS